MYAGMITFHLFQIHSLGRLLFSVTYPRMMSYIIDIGYIPRISQDICNRSVRLVNPAFLDNRKRDCYCDSLVILRCEGFLCLEMYTSDTEVMHILT